MSIVKGLVRSYLAMGLLVAIVFPASHASGQEDFDEDSEYCDGVGSGASAEDDDGSATLFAWNCCCGDDGNGDSGGDDDGPLVTDRPGFTTSPSTVGRGVWQFEMGYTFTQDDSATAGVRTRTLSHSYPELLVRVGLFADWFEVRLQQDLASQTVTTAGVSDSASGAQDLQLGCKVALTQQCGWLPQMTLLPQTTVPTGSPALTAGEMLPGLGWLYDWDITDKLSLEGNTLGNRDVDDDGHGFTVYAQSINATYQMTDSLSGFLEWYAFFPHSARSREFLPEQYFDGGFTYLLNDNCQLDVSAGLGLNRAADGHFVAAGLSVRM